MLVKLVIDKRSEYIEDVFPLVKEGIKNKEVSLEIRTSNTKAHSQLVSILAEGYIRLRVEHIHYE